MLPGRHSLFWRLALLLASFCLLVVWLSWIWGGRLAQQSFHLSEEAQAQLRQYAVEAEQAWQQSGPAGVDAWLARLAEREAGWASVLGANLQPLGSQALSPLQYQQLTFLRGVDWPMSPRQRGLPYLSLPFAEQPEQGRLVMQLPLRFLPEGFNPWLQWLIHGLLPLLLSLLLCVALYRLLLAPLRQLQAQANALRGNRLDWRGTRALSRRQDELGELARAFDHMTARLQGSLNFQRQLLRDLSHELRTPLSRLRVAGEAAGELDALRQRLEREVQGMRQLVDATLELVWLDSERPQLPLQAVSLRELWQVLVEDACFESGWQAARLPCRLPEGCQVLGHLNSLAQALENILRNAIRHSPVNGQVTLSGERQADDWLLCIEDQGGGVAVDALESIFRPFTRLQAERPGGEGYGLGLAIARRNIELQGGALWAENGCAGLRLMLRLPAAD